MQLEILKSHLPHVLWDFSFSNTAKTKNTMNTTDIRSRLKVALKHSALALAAMTGLAIGSAQALTTTATYNLGPQDAGTTILTGTAGFKQWIAKGTLPAGSIVRSISAAIRIDSSTSDSWTSDLLVYLDSDPVTPATAALLQIGGDYSGAVGTVAQFVGWAGGDGGPGTIITQTLTAGVDWTGNIDLNAVELSIGNNYAESSYSGTITVEYDVTTLTVALSTPANAQAYESGTSIMASAAVLDPGAFNNTVTFHTTPISPAGPTVQTVSSDVASPFTADLGVLPAGSYEIYATTVNTDIPAGTATSATRTFTVAAAVPTTTVLTAAGAPTTYGDNVTFTATVSPTPTGGTVQFYDGANYLGIPVAVNTGTGVATYSTTTLGVGTHVITAEYNGYQIYLTSTTAASISHEVGQAPLTVRALNTLRAPNTANPDPLPYQITGYRNGENLGSSGVTGTPSLTTAAILSSPVGNYTVTCALGTLAAANYSFTLTNGTLTVAEMTDTFSLNFYAYGNLPAESQPNVLMTEGLPAGLGDWFTSGWSNYEVPWAPSAPLAPVTLTSNLGSSATFTLKDCRNGWQSAGEPRTTNLGDGNYSMMGSGVNSTLDPGDGTQLFDMEVTGIPFAVYDVIFYIRANDGQFGDGTGVIKFNGGADRAFTLISGGYAGTFTEIVDATTPGNYIVFTGVTGSSFTAKTWGTGSGGFNHLGPAGIQIREAAAVSGFTAWANANAPGQTVDQDHDNDGVKNGLEYFMGQSGSSFTAMPVLDGTNTITWPMDAAYSGTYEVQTSPNLGTWTNVVPRPTPSGGSLSYLLPTGLGKQFVRLLVTPTP